MSHELLPEALLWAEGGHASDVVLTALADGQLDIVPASVRTHVEQCTSCMVHLGHAALLSLHAAREIEAGVQYGQLKRPVPWLAIALGLAFALLGLVPSLLDVTATSSLRAFVLHDVPLVLREAASALARLDPGGTASLVLTYGTAAFLVAMGFALVRLLPKKEVSR